MWNGVQSLGLQAVAEAWGGRAAWRKHRPSIKGGVSVAATRLHCDSGATSLSMRGWVACARVCVCLYKKRTAYIHTYIHLHMHGCVCDCVHMRECWTHKKKAQSAKNSDWRTPPYHELIICVQLLIFPMYNIVYSIYDFFLFLEED